MDERRKSIRLAKERWDRNVARAEKKKGFHRSRGGRRLERSDTYRSRILDLFGVKRPPSKDRRHSAPRHFRVPGNFSLTYNAEESLKFVIDLIQYARTAKQLRVVIDHRRITQLGLGAEALLAVVLKEIALENAGIPGAYIKGYRSQNPRVRKIMDEVGCVRVLGTGVDEDIKVSLRSKAYVFRHQNRGKRLVVDALTADPIAQTTRDFSDHLDSGLQLVGKRLSPKGRDRLLSYVAEVLINAQEHSETAQWVIVGFIDQEDEQLMYRAAIFSLGSTISETFETLDENSWGWKFVGPYMERHATSGLFSPSWRKSDLLTVIALQQNVSSKLDSSSSDRGQGTVDLIDFFQNVSMECGGSGASALMSIISGGTHIKFDGSYRMKHEQSLGRMVIAFNRENNLLQPPDKNVVRAMDKVVFPGVMISIAVPLVVGTVEEIPVESSNEN